MMIAGRAIRRSNRAHLRPNPVKTSGSGGRRSKGLVLAWAMSPLVMIAVVVAATTNVASAASCGFHGATHHQYVGQISNKVWEGVDAKIMDDDQTVGDNNTDSAEAWIGPADTNVTFCPGSSSGFCWIQDGYWVGLGGNGVPKTSVNVYGEDSSYYSYTFEWWSTLTLDTFNYFSDFNSGVLQNNGGQVQWLAYSTTHNNTVTLVRSGWYETSYDNSMPVQVNSESYDANGTDACPNWPSNEEFGYTSTGVTLSSAISLSPDGSSWSPPSGGEWNTTLDGGAPTPDTTHYYTGPDYHSGSDYYAFNMFGDGSYHS